MGAIGNAVVHGSEIWQIEQITHQQTPLCAQAYLDMVLLGK